MINPGEKDHLVIQPDDEIYCMSHQMITSSQMITSMMSSSQIICLLYIILSRTVAGGAVCKLATLLIEEQEVYGGPGLVTACLN
jgi:hypothetical protein